MVSDGAQDSARCTKKVVELARPRYSPRRGTLLDSIVAYEVLCSAPKSIAPALVTLGSPLGLPNLIFDRLDPSPVEGKGSWPGGTTSWTNIADRGDIVASVKKLAPLFGESVQDVLVDNEALAHDVGPYFTSQGTGKAVLDAIRAA